MTKDRDMALVDEVIAELEATLVRLKARRDEQKEAVRVKRRLD